MSGAIGVGWYDYQSGFTDYEMQTALVRRLLSRIATSTEVKVVAVYPGGLSRFTTVDVQPLVNQIDGEMNPTPHGTIYGLPVFRLQAGVAAIVIDPVVGDIGQAVFCSTDISGVIASQAQSSPTCFRMFDWADGVYLGGNLNPGPTEYIEFTNGAGIAITSPMQVTVTVGSTVLAVSASGVAITGNLTVSGNISAPYVAGTTDVLAGSGAAEVSGLHHNHSDVVNGGDASGPPIPI